MLESGRFATNNRERLGVFGGAGGVWFYQSDILGLKRFRALQRNFETGPHNMQALLWTQPVRVPKKRAPAPRARARARKRSSVQARRRRCRRRPASCHASPPSVSECSWQAAPGTLSRALSLLIFSTEADNFQKVRHVTWSIAGLIVDLFLFRKETVMCQMRDG